LGCLFAASLVEQAEAKVWLYDHKAERAALLAAQGIFFEYQDTKRCIPVQVTADPDYLGQPDFILLCVKSHQVQAALNQAKPLFSEKSLILALQNGIAHLPVLADQVGDLPWAAGVTSLGATLLAPGQVRFAGQGETRIGFFPTLKDRHDAKLVALAALLSRAGFKTTVVDNILDHIWAKFFVNIGINALTAIHDCPNGALLESEEIKQKMLAAVQEAILVAQAQGIRIIHDPIRATMEVCRATASNLSSMLQDVRNRRPTEIDAINGALVNEARRLGMTVPVNESLVQHIHALEQAYNSK
jgi:2-dehydropantoate 2-reductase